MLEKSLWGYCCSCLENPRDGGAWWAAVYGVTESQTQLKRLSSSSSYFIDEENEAETQTTFEQQNQDKTCWHNPKSGLLAIQGRRWYTVSQATMDNRQFIQGHTQAGKAGGPNIWQEWCWCWGSSDHTSEYKPSPNKGHELTGRSIWRRDWPR